MNQWRSGLTAPEIFRHSFCVIFVNDDFSDILICTTSVTVIKEPDCIRALCICNVLLIFYEHNFVRHEFYDKDWREKKANTAPCNTEAIYVTHFAFHILHSTKNIGVMVGNNALCGYTNTRNIYCVYHVLDLLPEFLFSIALFFSRNISGCLFCFHCKWAQALQVKIGVNRFHNSKKKTIVLSAALHRRLCTAVYLIPV